MCTVLAAQVEPMLWVTPSALFQEMIRPRCAPWNGSSVGALFESEPRASPTKLAKRRLCLKRVTFPSDPPGSRAGVLPNRATQGAEPAQVRVIPDKARPLPVPKAVAIVPVAVGAAPVLERDAGNALGAVADTQAFPSPLRQLQSDQG